MRIGILARHQSVSSSLMGSNVFTYAVTASMKINFQNLARPLSCERRCQCEGTYMPSSLGAEGLLRISPHVAIARKFDAQLRQRLPNQHHHTVRWMIEVHPYHWLVIVNDGRRKQEALNDGRERDLSAGREVMCRNKMHMFYLVHISNVRWLVVAGQGG